jgi:hypothetical protein
VEGREDLFNLAKNGVVFVKAVVNFSILSCKGYFNCLTN